MPSTQGCAKPCSVWQPLASPSALAGWWVSAWQARNVQSEQMGKGRRRHMSTVTQPLREEHKELLPHIEALRSVGDSVAVVPLESLRESVAQVLQFLTHHLLPHAQAEEQALYPVVAR